ncbi:hypothetical protein [Bacillus sp. NPDC060175]|uniref:hypothetical protein n=1 Tax=Bacillus sp. NPDC060175 TaxID=3347061 RepID=UPI00364922E5
MPRDILTDAGVPKEAYKNAQGKMIEITHVQVTYYELKKDDRKRFIILSVDKANKFANQNGINGPYVSASYDKEGAKKNQLPIWTAHLHNYRYQK